jgi:hypothetical protein
MPLDTLDHRILSEDLRLEFKRAINPGRAVVRLIKPDNTARDEVPWSDHLHEYPHAVYLFSHQRCRTLGLDFDAGRADAARADADARYAQRLLNLAGIESVLVESGPSDGRHVFATIDGYGVTERHAKRIAQGLVKLGLQTLDPTAMCNPHTGAMRPPLSLHRRGGQSEVLDVPADEALRLLNNRQPAWKFELLSEALPQPGDRAPRRLTSPDRANVKQATTTYASGSEELEAVAARFCNAGQSYAAFRSSIDDGKELPPRALASVRKHRTDGDLEAWLTKSWKAVEAFVRSSPAIARRPNREPPEVLDAWEASLLHAPLTDRARRVALAMHQLAVREQRVLIGMSVRQASNIAGVSVTAAHEALADLERGGLLVTVGESKAQWARRFVLKHPDDWEPASTGTHVPNSLGGVRSLTVPGMTQAAALAVDLTADIWMNKGLGERARHIYHALTHGLDGELPVPTAVLAARTGRQSRTVDRALKDLEGAGLARRVGRALWTGEYADPTSIADELGVTGANDAQRTANAADTQADLRRRVESRLESGLEARTNRPHGNSGSAENHSQIAESSVRSAPVVRRHPKTVIPSPTPALVSAGDLHRLPPYETENPGDTN